MSAIIIIPLANNSVAGLISPDQLAILNLLADGANGQFLTVSGGALDWLLAAPSATTDTTNAANISSGTLPFARIASASVLQANSSLSNSNSAQNIFPTGQGTVSLAASTTYQFKALYQISRSAGTTSHTIATLFANSAAIGYASYVAFASSGNSNILTPAQNLQVTSLSPATVTAANANTTETVTIKLAGVLATNGAVNITPQIQYSAAPGGAPTVLQGSFIEFVPMFASSANTAGTWA